jgi:hypothetical protein
MIMQSVSNPDPNSCENKNKKVDNPMHLIPAIGAEFSCFVYYPGLLSKRYSKWNLYSTYLSYRLVDSSVGD